MRELKWFEKELRYLGKTYKDFDELYYSGVEAIPFHVVRQFLYPMSWQEFVDLLNIPSDSKKHLVTNAEEDFREHERKKDGTPFFLKKEILNTHSCQISEERKSYIETFFSVDLDDWLSWIYENPEILPENRNKGRNTKKQKSECAHCEALRAENAALKAQIAEMERARQEHSGSGAKPIDPREKNTLLAIAYAAIKLRNGVFPDRDLASKLERTIQHELPEMEISARTIRNKLNDIKNIIK